LIVDVTRTLQRLPGALRKVLPRITIDRCGAIEDNADKTTRHLEDRSDAIEEEAALQMEKQHDTRSHKDLPSSITFCMTAVSSYCAHVGQVKEFLFKAMMCNLNYVGSRWGVLISSIAEHIALQVNESPHRSVALVICPLSPARSEADDYDAIVDMVREGNKRCITGGLMTRRHPNDTFEVYQHNRQTFVFGVPPLS